MTSEKRFSRMIGTIALRTKGKTGGFALTILFETLYKKGRRKHNGVQS